MRAVSRWSRWNCSTLHKAAVNRYLDVQGFRALEQSAADLDCIAHQTEAVKNWMKASRERGLKGGAGRARQALRGQVLIIRSAD